MTTTKPLPTADLKDRARRLGLFGLLARLDEIRAEPWVERLLALEEEERSRRSLERRLRNARLGRFKPMADFDWGWPKSIDRDLLDEVFRLGFLDEAANVILVGPNGVGKTMIAKRSTNPIWRIA
jgi:DNA replication protein DnaC